MVMCLSIIKNKTKNLNINISIIEIGQSDNIIQLPPL